MLKLKNLNKNYYVMNQVIPALKNVNLEFRESEFVSVLGPSGCGKTTLLNIIGGLDRYTSGDLIITANYDINYYRMSFLDAEGTELAFAIYAYQEIIYLTDFNEGGANILRVGVDGMPVALAFYKRKILERKWKFSNIFINISLLNFIFMIFSLHNWIFARFGMYLSLVNLILLPYLIKNCFKGNERKILYMSCVIAYFVFYWFENSYFV